MNYDYATPGAYFITICTYQRECLLGEIVDGVIILNDLGEIVNHVWHDLPNHVHGIIFLTDSNMGCRGESETHPRGFGDIKPPPWRGEWGGFNRFIITHRLIAVSAVDFYTPCDRCCLHLVIWHPPPQTVDIRVDFGLIFPQNTCSISCFRVSSVTGTTTLLSLAGLPQKFTLQFQSPFHTMKFHLS